MDGQAGNVPGWIGKDSSCRGGSSFRGETGIEKACGATQDSRLGGRFPVTFRGGLPRRHRGGAVSRGRGCRFWAGDVGEILRVLLQCGRLPVRSGRGPSKLLRRPRTIFPSLLRTGAVASGDGRRENERCLTQSNSRRASPGPDRKARIGALKKGRKNERCLAQSDGRRAPPGSDRKARVGIRMNGREEEAGGKAWIPAFTGMTW